MTSLSKRKSYNTAPRISVRLPEKETLEQEAVAHGLNLSDYLKVIIASRTRKKNEVSRMAKKLFGEIRYEKAG